tara:strand:- start:199 stop:765 length:567 start_codon:yes stop_codon:yes gene_type:complete
MTGPIVKAALLPFVEQKGINILEAGSGLSESSALIDFQDQRYISLDISNVALGKNVNDQIKLQGDLFNIPITDKQIDLIFNVGVHEHYCDEENEKIFNEYYRVLKKNGLIVLLWPHYYGPLMLLAKLINKVITVIRRKKYEIWPDQHNEIKNYKKVDNLLNKSGFSHVDHYMSIYDLFSTVVLTYNKN